MKPFRSSFSSYIAETTDYRESEPIDPALLESLVARLRTRDFSVCSEIIAGHLRMVMAIVGDKVRSKRKVDDVVGAALLALTQAVHDAPDALYDNNITYYITTMVKYAIKDELGRDHTVRAPARTVRYRIAKGDKFEDIVPGECVEIGEDVPHADQGEEPVKKRGSFLPFHIPAAKPICESAEFKEAIAKAVTTPMEQAIVNLRAEGYNYEEIGIKVGLSTPRIGQIVPIIEERFSRIYDR